MKKRKMKEICQVSTIESISRYGYTSKADSNDDVNGSSGSAGCCCDNDDVVGSNTNSMTIRVILMAVIANLFSIGFGCVHRYMAPDYKKWRPYMLNFVEISWRESLLQLGVAAGCLLSANLVDLLGRKLTILSTSLLCIVGLTIEATDASINLMYAGLLLAGFAALITFSAITVYLSEISPSAHRGLLLSLCNLSVTLGELTITLVGTALPWNWLAIFSAGFFALSPTLLVFFPESPRWLLMKGNTEAAAESLALFRGKQTDCNKEMEVIKSGMPAVCGACSAWKALAQPSNLKTLALCSVLIIVQQFTGNQVLSVYRTNLRGAAGVHLSPYIVNTITGLSSTIGGVACMLLIERLGRRVLLILSMALMSISMVTYAAYFQVISDEPHLAVTWLPLSCVAVHNFSFRMGLWQIPNIWLCELLPTEARGVGNAVMGSFANLVGFASLKSFFYIVQGVQYSGCFLIYTGLTVGGSIFAAIFVFDTSQRIMK